MNIMRQCFICSSICLSCSCCRQLLPEKNRDAVNDNVCGCRRSCSLGGVECPRDSPVMVIAMHTRRCWLLSSSRVDQAVVVLFIDVLYVLERVHLTILQSSQGVLYLVLQTPGDEIACFKVQGAVWSFPETSGGYVDFFLCLCGGTSLQLNE